MKKVALSILFAAVATFPIFAQTGSPNRQRTAPTNQNNVPASKARPTLADPNAVPPPPPSRKPKEEDEVITVETNLVTTPVSVMDRNGRFIPGLKKKDFKIFENGVPQTITYFQSEEQPFTVVLMIDISPSTKYHIDQIHFAALTFVNQLRPADKVMVVAFDQRTRVLCEPTSERAALYSAIYKAQFGSGTSLYDAVDAVTSLELVNTPGRKAVVLFTDGVDTTSRRANYQSTIAAVEEIDALFYPIRYNTQTASGVVSSATGAATQMPADVSALLAARGIAIDPRAFRVSGRGQSPAEYATGKAYLESLALNSGGRMFEAESLTNLEVSFSGVAEELRRRYSIGYYGNTDSAPGGRKQIKIQVARPRAVVRAKTNYVVKQKRETTETPSSPGLQSRIMPPRPLG